MQRDDRDLDGGAGSAPINRDAYPEDAPAGAAERRLDPLAPGDPLRDVEHERERLYPAPLSGVEPLEGHAVEPDAEEASVDDALLRERADAGWERAGELDTQPARLGGAEGLGVMRVVRSADGVAVSMPGTWRPPAGAALEQRFVAGTVIRYEGPLHLGDGTVQEVVEDVRVTSAGRYVTEDGEEYDIVNFEAVAGPGAAERA
ncbi:MAG TPA: hypothetical protein VFF08_07355 [Trueperaceae bacterium]|nr:hypothetical protein [Trueperaceae bacterium]